jgi:hypothetical protein
MAPHLASGHPWPPILRQHTDLVPMGLASEESPLNCILCVQLSEFRRPLNDDLRQLKRWGGGVQNLAQSVDILVTISQCLFEFLVDGKR